MKDKQTQQKVSSLQLVNFCGSWISREQFQKLMKDENEKEAYFEYLRGR